MVALTAGSLGCLFSGTRVVYFCLCATRYYWPVIKVLVAFEAYSRRRGRATSRSVLRHSGGGRRRRRSTVENFSLAIIIGLARNF